MIDILTNMENPHTPKLNFLILLCTSIMLLVHQLTQSNITWVLSTAMLIVGMTLYITQLTFVFSKKKNTRLEKRKFELEIELLEKQTKDLTDKK